MWQGIPGQAPMMPGQPGAPQMPGQQRPKLEPIDWNLVAVLDADLIRRTKDYDSLQRLLQCFLTARLVQGNSRILAHPLVLRLCQLLQVGIEYLNFCQGELQNHYSKLEAEKMGLEDKVKTLEHKMKKLEMLIKVKSQPYHRCPVCDKKFKGIDYIDRHILNRHSELMEAWDIIRGRKSPEKTDSVQQILDKIDNLKNTLKRGDLANDRKRNIEQQLFQTQKDLMQAEEQQDEEALRKREEIRRQFFMAADDLNSSMHLWKEQRANAPPKFNLFQDDKPAKSKPPEVAVPPGAERIFGKQADFDVEGPQFDAPEPIFDEPPPPAQQPQEEKPEDIDESKFPKRFTKDVMKSARSFVSLRKQEGRTKFAQPNVESVMAVISERVRKEMAKIKDGCKGTRITTEAVDAQMGGKGADYEATRMKLMKKLEKECPLEAEAPVKMEMKNKQGKAKVVEVKPVEISLIHTDYFETKESSEYSDFTEEQMSSTIPREIRQKKTPQKGESPKKQTQKTPQKQESPKKQTQKTPKIEPEFESSDEEKQPRTVLSSHSGIDPEALSEGSDEEEFTSAFELPPKITPLDASAQKDVIESVLDFEEEEEPAEQTSFDLSPMPSPTPKGKKKQQPKQETYEYEYEYEYYSDAPSKSSPEKSSHRKTPKSTPKPAPKASPKPAPSMPTRNSPKGTVLSSAKHINRHRAEDTKAVFLSESEGSPNKSSEVVVTKKKQEIDYDKLAKEKLRKEFDFVFDEEEDKQETTESVHIEPMYTSESGAYATDFSISSISAESSQVAPKQKKMSFQIAKGPTAVSIEPQKEMQQSRSPQKGERQSSNQNRSPQKEPRSSDVPRAVPANPQREMPQSKYINAEMSRQAIAPMKPQKEIPPARNLDAEMARQAAALTKQPKKSKPRNSTQMEADLEEWEDDFSRDAPPSPNSPPRKTPEKRERPRVQVPMLDSGSDDEFERDYAVDDFPGDSPMMSSSPLDERFVTKKKLRQTFYESPKAPKAAAPAEDDMMSTDPEPMPKPASKKSAAVAFLGRLFGKR